jgi:repressor LexA
MHTIQEKLLELAKIKNLAMFSLREIGAFIGETSPQKVKHHMGQLEKRGLLHIDKAHGVIKNTRDTWDAPTKKQKGGLLMIPILGYASAGPATAIAEENIEGFLRISESLVKPRPASHVLFAIRVKGPSMNRATIDKKKIEDGDYVIVDTTDRNPKNGDIILSIIDGMANIKRFHKDEENKQIILISDSSQDFPPIYIHENDNYMINGKVVQVIKKPKL